VFEKFLPDKINMQFTQRINRDERMGLKLATDEQKI